MSQLFDDFRFICQHDLLYDARISVPAAFIHISESRPLDNSPKFQRVFSHFHFSYGWVQLPFRLALVGQLIIHICVRLVSFSPFLQERRYFFVLIRSSRTRVFQLVSFAVEPHELCNKHSNHNNSFSNHSDSSRRQVSFRFDFRFRLTVASNSIVHKIQNSFNGFVVWKDERGILSGKVKVAWVQNKVNKVDQLFEVAVTIGGVILF
mmetsp:Transcript_5980/g.8363  ORF Transcript_5980/g.8363 Transcript_5980/m.8363 type:complete len:207 (+) Transcript_5980:616-1236(+)